MKLMGCKKCGFYSLLSTRPVRCKCGNIEAFYNDDQTCTVRLQNNESFDTCAITLIDNDYLTMQSGGNSHLSRMDWWEGGCYISIGGKWIDDPVKEKIIEKNYKECRDHIHQVTLPNGLERKA